MALQHSKAMIGIHLSMNNLTYYDRLFLRILMNSKATSHFRNLAAKDKFLSRGEDNNLDNIQGYGFMQEDLKFFLKSFKYVEEQSMKLDEELSEVLKNVDVSMLF